MNKNVFDKVKNFLRQILPQPVKAVIKTEQKLDKVLDAGSKAPEPKPAPAAEPAAASPTPAASTVKPSELVEKQEEEEKAKEKPPVEGRRICPKCGGLTFNTVEDQSQVLFQQGGMKIYAKKYICKSCGTEA